MNQPFIVNAFAKAQITEAQEVIINLLNTYFAISIGLEFFSKSI